MKILSVRVCAVLVFFLVFSTQAFRLINVNTAYTGINKQKTDSHKMHTYERHACTHVTRAPHNPVIEQLRNQTPNLLNDPDHWQHTGPIRVFTLVCVFFFHKLLNVLNMVQQVLNFRYLSTVLQQMSFGILSSPILDFKSAELLESRSDTYYYKS